MNEFDVIIDLGSKNLKLGVFDPQLKMIYSSKQKILNSKEDSSLENSLKVLIRNAEKYLSSHIDDVVVLHDSSKFYSLDLSIKKVFDQFVSLTKVYETIIQEAQYLISQNNFKDQIIHLEVNNIIADDNKKINKIDDKIKIKSLILEIKFICFSKTIIKKISNKFKNNNLKISNFYCSSYVKSFFYNKMFGNNDCIIFLDIGYERSTSLIFNNDKLDFFKSIPLGGNNITKDISKVLNLNLDYSENLKIAFNTEENDMIFGETKTNQINLFSQISKKKISMNLLKEIIVARIDEILALAVFKSDYIENLKKNMKPKLVIIGSGSKLIAENYNLSIKKIISESVIFDENDLHVCEGGLHYHISNESLLSKSKKKIKKTGFFETFFNIFSR